MSRRWNKMVWFVYVPATIVVLLVATLLVVIATFDWNRLKPTINERVSQTLGRSFVIQGDLHVTWAREPSTRGLASLVPWPMLEARDIAVANPDWAKQPQFALLDAVRFRLTPLPMLAHRVEIPTLYLVHPRLDLERDPQGRATWDFQIATSNQPSTWQVNLGAIGFDSSEITLDDAVKKINLHVRVEPLQQAIPYDEIVKQQSSDAREQARKTVGAGARAVLSKEAANGSDQPGHIRTAYQFAWQVDGRYQGVPVKGSGKTGAVLALQQADEPFPLQADMHAGDSHIALVGTLVDPLHLAALDIRLWFSGTSMAKLYPLTGVTLPDTPPYATEGHLKANLQRAGSHFSYENFRGRVGGSDLSGDLTFDTGDPRPKLSGNVKARLLRFADLAPLIGADSNAEKQQRGDATPQPPDKVLPVEPFRTDRWRAMDADVTFSADRIVREEALPIDALSTHVVMNNGTLGLEPLTFGLAGGTMNSHIRLDGSNATMQGTVGLKARHLKLKELFPTFAPMQTSFGEINGDAELTAHGNSVSALLGSSNGEVKLLMNDGAISKALLETAGLNVGNIVISKLFGDKTVKINCAASDLAATNGLYQTRLFVFDTEDATVRINGTVNFGNEQLDLDIRPNSKGLRVLSLRSPLYVKGTMKNPDVGVQPGPLILRGAGAVAMGVFATPAAALLPLVAASKGAPDNTCATVLAEMSSPSKVSQPPANGKKQRR